MNNLHTLYADAPRTLKHPDESVDAWIERERKQKAFIGQTLRPDEEQTLRRLAEKHE